MTPLPLIFGLEEEAAPHPVELLTQQGCLHSGPQLQSLVVSEDGLIPMSDLLVSFIAVGPAEGISWKSLDVSERGVGVGEAWTRADAKNSRLVESPPSEVQEAGEMGRSTSLDILEDFSRNQF